MPRDISPRTTLENLKREAKRWLRALRANVSEARARFQRALPNAPELPTLRHVQHALALEHGLSGWGALKNRLAQDEPLRRYEKVADAVVTAYRTGDASAMRIVWDYFGHRRARDTMRRYMRLDLGKPEQPQRPEDDVITLDEARYLVARAQGFETWDALVAYVTSIPPGKTIAEKAVGLFSPTTESGTPLVAARSRDWDEVLAIMRERQIPGLHAMGQMTDELLERVSHLPHVTHLELEGSKHLSDHGLRHLARLPHLKRLNLMGTRITDRGLEVLHRLPALESIVLAWTSITDAGAAHLAACDNLRTVDLTATSCGDGAIRALAGKPKLHELKSGNDVTDAGLAALHEIPVFKTWQGGEARMHLLSPDAGPNFLDLHGAFSDADLSKLDGLDGLYALSLNGSRVTGAGFASLARLPHLSWLAFDATDESMPYIAALPHLRFLLCQDTVAGDDGFVALSRSQTVEYIWGRRCYNLRRRGFVALADMPALRALSVSCKNVDDIGLSALPRFPALRELMPMDVPDDGYVHVGRCEGLESLVLMYCRETTDVSTQHIVRLPGLRKYFASYNRITDRTPELLSEMQSLEEITFDTCTSLTNSGVAALARLRRLRELRVSSMPHVTADVAAAFQEGVRVSYSP